MRVDRPGETDLWIEVETELETDRVGRVLADMAQPGLVIGLVGNLGAGKTRLVRAIAEGLGVDPHAIASPTFVLIHEYLGRLPIAHFDAYRLASSDEFDALGASDYWSEGEGVCLIEWADLVADRLPTTTWWVRLEATGPTSRVIRLTMPDPERVARLLENSSGQR